MGWKLAGGSGRARKAAPTARTASVHGWRWFPPETAVTGLLCRRRRRRRKRWERLMPKREAASEASIAPELKLSRVRWTSSLASRWPIWRFLHGVIQAQRQGAVPTVGMAGCQGSVGELRCKKPVAQAPGPMSHRAAGPPDPEASGSQAGRSAARVARARGDHGQPKGPGKRAARSG